MWFLIDEKKKVIFGWSAKCGCSHIKKIYWFLQGVEKTNIHGDSYQRLPDETKMKNYTTIIFSRNPYKRIVSGFLDKYKIGGEFRNNWKENNITFITFIEKLIKNKDILEKKNWNETDFDHFTPQTSQVFEKNKILSSKCIQFFDIENINYSYLEELYNKKIPKIIIDFQFGHERSNRINKNIIINKPVYNLNMDEYSNNKVETQYFYNKELKEKIFHFYKNDFIFFQENGIDYINSPI